jgi:hypothetical protein
MTVELMLDLTFITFTFECIESGLMFIRFIFILKIF